MQRLRSLRRAAGMAPGGTVLAAAAAARPWLGAAGFVPATAACSKGTLAVGALSHVKPKA